MGYYPPASSAGAAHSFVGYNTVGGSTEAIANNGYYKQIVLATGALIASIGASIAGNTASQGFVVAVMDDNAGAPGKVLAINGATPVTSPGELNTTRRWIHLPIGCYVAAGTYWIVFASAYNTGTTSIAYDGSGGDGKMAGQSNISDASISNPTIGTNKYSIRASILSPL